MSGKCSWVLVFHNSLDYARDDPNFGRKFVEAILSSRRGHETIIPVSAHSVAHKGSATVGVVVGNYFSGDTHTQIAISEKGTPWLANGYGRPAWSTLTKADAMYQLFGNPKPRISAEKPISKIEK